MMAPVRPNAATATSIMLTSGVACCVPVRTTGVTVNGVGSRRLLVHV